MTQIEWNFDRLENIGGAPTEVEGHPEIISTPAGKAVAFNGVDDALFIAQHPLAGAATFTIEAVFRPDGGAFEQRWLHLAEADATNGEAQSPRILFEVRVVGDKWYLDAFTKGPGYDTTLVVPEKTFPLGRWYRVEQSFDGSLDEANAISAFNAHNDEVRRQVPPERLLDYEVGQGWEPLCSFLGLPVPATPFPRVNNADDFAARFPIRR